LAEAGSALGAAVMVPGRVGLELKWLVGHVSSRVAGCRFCWAHTAHNAVHQIGVGAEKFEQVWEFESCDRFDDRERAALRLAAAAGCTPNAVTDEHFVDLRQYFDDDEILELVAVIALFGFANRWNDTLAVTLEEPPLRFAEEHLAPSGWTAGRHA
jgi:alkylhydroperoxidase family enzyme